MSTPSPQPSSLLLSPNPEQLDWGQLARTISEFLALREQIRGVPHGWVQWVERRSLSRLTRGKPIRFPLPYRIACLQSGIMLLQESKFLTDVFENALRYSVVQHLSDHEAPVAVLLATVPQSTQLRDRIAGKSTASEIVLELDFYQLTELIFRNWKWIGIKKNRVPGFCALFWSTLSCRDCHAFRRDATLVRKLRNVVAHSKQLVTQDQVSKVYGICRRWLMPLAINIDDRVFQYRQRRPGFLSDLHRISSVCSNSNLLIPTTIC